MVVVVVGGCVVVVASGVGGSVSEELGSAAVGAARRDQTGHEHEPTHSDA